MSTYEEYPIHYPVIHPVGPEVKKKPPHIHPIGPELPKKQPIIRPVGPEIRKEKYADIHPIGPEVKTKKMSVKKKAQLVGDVLIFLFFAKEAISYGYKIATIVKNEIIDNQQIQYE